MVNNLLASISKKLWYWRRKVLSIFCKEAYSLSNTEYAQLQRYAERQKNLAIGGHCALCGKSLVKDTEYLRDKETWLCDSWCLSEYDRLADLSKLYTIPLDVIIYARNDKRLLPYRLQFDIVRLEDSAKSHDTCHSLLGPYKDWKYILAEDTMFFSKVTDDN